MNAKLKIINRLAYKYVWINAKGLKWMRSDVYGGEWMGGYEMILMNASKD